MPRRLSPVVLNLIIINVLIFLFLNLVGRNNPDIAFKFYLFKPDVIPFIPRSPMLAAMFHPVQLVTSMFAHMDLMHILFNMLALAFIGPAIETVMGSKRFISFYLFAGLFSTVMLALFDPSENPVLGASGAISGVLVAFAYYYPTAKLGILFLPFQFKARDFVLGIAGISLVLVIVDAVSAGNSVGGISHFGHLAGMAGGWLFLNQNKFLGKLGK